MVDKVGGWVFVSSAAGWEWRRMDPHTGEELKRGGPFRSLIACMTDATANGYLAPGHNEPASPKRR